MSSAIIDILYRADKGFSRTALRDELMATERFRDQINKNVNSYYNNVSRYKKQGKIVEINSLLYHPDRAPLPDGDPDPLGLHLPADNVSSLFGPVKRSIDV